jgi:hypothetical protein
VLDQLGLDAMGGEEADRVDKRVCHFERQ